MKTDSKSKKSKKSAAKSTKDEGEQTTALSRTSLDERRKAALALIKPEQPEESKPEDTDVSQTAFIHFFHTANENSTTEACKQALKNEGERTGTVEDLKLGMAFLVKGGEAVRIDNRNEVYILPLASQQYWASATRNAEEFTLHATSMTKQPGMSLFGHAAGIMAILNPETDEWMMVPFTVEAARGRIDGIESMRKSINAAPNDVAERKILSFSSPVAKSKGNKWTSFKAPVAPPTERSKSAAEAMRLYADSLGEDIVEVMERFANTKADVDSLLG